MYCDAAGSPRRRATQAAMHEVFSSLTRLLAPILAFTAEEAWGYFATGESVHSQLFPAPREVDADALADGERLLQLRSLVSQALEKARADKIITNNLEAEVTLTLADKTWAEKWRPRLAELEEFFILSALKLEAGSADAATVEKTDASKCGRCWRHRDTVGANTAHPDLCDRCSGAVQM
jgi:isoleucyl-tRNA synthetase